MNRKDLRKKPPVKLNYESLGRFPVARPEKIKHAWMSLDEHMHVCAPSSLLPLVLSILHTFKPSAGLINELLQGWSKR